MRGLDASWGALNAHLFGHHPGTHVHTFMLWWRVQGICKPANPDLWKSHAHTTGGEIPTQELNWDSTRCSVFRPAAQSQGQGQAGEGGELGDDASGDDD